MKISDLRIILIGTFLIIINSAALYAGYFFEDGQNVVGGTEARLYGFNTIIVENTLTANGVAVEPVTDRAIAVGASTSGFYSENYQVYYIPLSLTFTNKLTISASIPWVSRTVKDDGEEFKASGLGDISGGLSLSVDFPLGITGDTSLKTVFPTGDNTKADNNYYIPLGSGGYSFNLTQSFSRKFGNFSIFANGSIVYSLETKSMIVGATEYTFHNGNVYSSLAGIEYTLFDTVIFTIKGNYVQVSEGQAKTQVGGWQDANDSLQTSDAIGGLKINIWSGVISIYAMYIKPVYTKNDSDIKDPKERKGGVCFGVTGLL